MSTINFKSIRLSNFRIDIDIEVTDHNTDNGNYQMFFEFNCPISDINTNLIAIALTTCCGKAYKNINFDTDISQEILNKIENFTSAKITCNNIIERSLSNFRINSSLMFSGGMDSLAANILLPKNTLLFSIDFKGIFAREKEYFSKYDTIIMSTNLVDMPFRKNSWSFMGIPIILLCEKFSIKKYTFGNILEAYPGNIRNKISFRNDPFPLFEICNMQAFPCVLGLTEVATMIICAKEKPEEYLASLKSLANPGEEKFYRKRVLSKIINDKYKLSLNLDSENQLWKPYYTFGQKNNFAIDFLSFYIAKNIVDDADKIIYKTPVTNDFSDIIKNLKLNFYERYNPNFYNVLDSNYVIEKMHNLGIKPYDENDWHELSIIRNYLQKYYPI